MRPLRPSASHCARGITFLCGGIAFVAVGCGNAGGWFQLGPRPATLAGIWVDSAQATPTDTVAWVLAPDGATRTLRVRVGVYPTGHPVVARKQTRDGWWYLSGTLGDTSRQDVCVKRRPRDGPSCARFRLDTLAASAGTPGRRRLRVAVSPGERHPQDRILLERR